jgi:glycosyltransferase involved in cell wall biosynthesis
MFTGQVWVTRSGIKRAGLKFFDKVIARNATSVLIDSRSQRQFLIDEGVVEPAKSEVLGEGSISGVDTVRFHPDAARRQTVRDELKIAASDIVVLFLGRVARDKGVLDLARAFVAVHEQCGHAVLLVAGPEENEMVPRMREILHPCLGAVRFIPYTRFPEHFMAASDIFCLPSYREGFGNAVINGETGVLVPPADPEALSKEIVRMASDDAIRKKLGARARERSISSFEATKITRVMMDYYQNIIK